MEEQRAQAGGGEQQRVAYRKAREHRHQNGGAEHHANSVWMPSTNMRGLPRVVAS